MTHLHLHTMYSLLDGISSSMDYIKKAKEYNHKAIAITDHGRMNGVFYHYNDCINNGIKPIIGCEMYLNNELVHMEGEKRKRTRDKHIILLASNKEGYKNLLRLNYLSMSDETHFYYSPRIAFEELFDNSNGIVCGTACIGSPFSHLLRENRTEEAENLFDTFLGIFKERFYAEIQLNELTNEIDELTNGQKTYNEWIIEQANKKGVPIVITGDVHYAERGMDKIQTLSIAIRDGATIDNLNFELESKNLHYHSIQDYYEFNERFGYNYPKEKIDEWCNNSDYIADMVNFDFEKRTKAFLPKLTPDDDVTIIAKAKTGLQKRFNAESYENCPEKYRKRLEYELSIILKKGFSSYFLILEDAINYAHENGISVGLARGSGGGSLLSYCLEITQLDPLKFDLLFERFMSTTRSPDMVYDYFTED